MFPASVAAQNLASARHLLRRLSLVRHRSLISCVNLIGLVDHLLLIQGLSLVVHTAFPGGVRDVDRFGGLSLVVLKRACCELIQGRHLLLLVWERIPRLCLLGEVLRGLEHGRHRFSVTGLFRTLLLFLRAVTISYSTVLDFAFPPLSPRLLQLLHRHALNGQLAVRGSDLAVAPGLLGQLVPGSVQRRLAAQRRVVWAQSFAVLPPPPLAGLLHTVTFWGTAAVAVMLLAQLLVVQTGVMHFLQQHWLMGRGRRSLGSSLGAGLHGHGDGRRRRQGRGPRRRPRGRAAEVPSFPCRGPLLLGVAGGRGGSRLRPGSLRRPPSVLGDSLWLSLLLTTAGSLTLPSPPLEHVREADWQRLLLALQLAAAGGRLKGRMTVSASAASPVSKLRGRLVDSPVRQLAAHGRLFANCRGFPKAGTQLGRHSPRVGGALRALRAWLAAHGLLSRMLLLPRALPCHTAVLSRRRALHATSSIDRASRAVAASSGAVVAAAPLLRRRWSTAAAILHAGVTVTRIVRVRSLVASRACAQPPASSASIVRLVACTRKGRAGPALAASSVSGVAGTRPVSTSVSIASVATVVVKPIPVALVGSTGVATTALTAAAAATAVSWASLACAGPRLTPPIRSSVRTSELCPSVSTVAPLVSPVGSPIAAGAASVGVSSPRAPPTRLLAGGQQHDHGRRQCAGPRPSK